MQVGAVLEKLDARCNKQFHYIYFAFRQRHRTRGCFVVHQPDFLTGTMFPEIIGYCTYNTHPLTPCPLKTHTPPNITSSLVASALCRTHLTSFLSLPFLLLISNPLVMLPELSTTRIAPAPTTQNFLFLLMFTH